MLRAALATLALLAAAPAGAVSTACPGDFAGGEPPVLVNPKLARDAYPLCLSGFATLFSGVTRTPVYSAEHLTAARVDAAHGMVRVNSFHPEPQLPESVRSDLSDYRHSGYDRGHMAPNGDMGDEASQRDSFSLANMVPQDHNNNAGLWAVRDTAEADGEAYVVTGPLYQGADVAVLQDRVYVPTGLWKAVYETVPNIAGAYVADNRPGWGYRRVSIDELTRLTGVDPFPSGGGRQGRGAPRPPLRGDGMVGTMKSYADDKGSLTVGGLRPRTGRTGSACRGRSTSPRTGRASTTPGRCTAVVAALEAEPDLPERAAAPKPAAASRKPNPFA